MLTYISLAIVTFISGFSVYLEVPSIIKNQVTERYRRWKSLNTLIRTNKRNNNNNCVVIYISCKMIVQAMYLSLVQYMNNSVKKVDKNVYEVSYQIKGKTYKIIVIPDKGPNKILQISNDSQIDVTNHVLPYLGPNYNWHGTKLAPKFFGYKSLTFELYDGSEKTFTDDCYVNIR
jgi:hypothetical protein